MMYKSARTIVVATFLATFSVSVSSTAVSDNVLRGNPFVNPPCAHKCRHDHKHEGIVKCPDDDEEDKHCKYVHAATCEQWDEIFENCAKDCPAWMKEEVRKKAGCDEHASSLLIDMKEGIRKGGASSGVGWPWASFWRL